MDAMNPLLDNTELPAFDRIRPEHVGPAVDQLLADAEAALERAVGPDVPADHDTLALLLDVPVERLRRAWAHVNHLQSVADSPALREAHAQALPRIVDFTTRLGADHRLYAKYKAVATSPAAAQLSPAQRKALTDTLRDFVLGGAELQGAARERHAAIQDRLAALGKTFGDRSLDATDAFQLVVPEERLAGVPDDVRDAARNAAVQAGQPGCLLTLQIPCYLPVLQFAQDRALREQLFRAYNTRASELGPAAFDNTGVMAEMLALRTEEAALLGHGNYAELALVPKMARTPEEVLAFVRQLAARARPSAERELAEMREFAAAELGIADLQAWDRYFVAEKLKQARYAFSSQEVKQYFTEPKVLQGLFGLIETLFDVAIRLDSAPVWHETVRYFRVWRGDKPVAAFYLDPYARAGKQSGAWMDDSRGRWRRPEGGLQLPVAHLVCNFAAPVGTQPALLTHQDVVTLFHEFGHGLHHMLTQVDELSVAGISGVEGDAIELPSQFMENFCWEWEVLQRLTAHVQTGEPLPRALFERMHAARNFQKGLMLLRQCEYALFDMRVHTEPGSATRAMAVCEEVNAEVQPERAPDFARYPCTFGHLFDGGYAAGYYGYAWAEVLSADAYGAFEEAGVFDPATGRRFRQEILEVGGSRPALESFRAFRGREPRLDALLRHQGLA
ncbi:oligopeptidase A [beta proteobacterium AAP121]|nr:oligopeptidase A [beta proteobacterium AAP65]KPF99609.1 oligopeptidase A [beta proteobacterium AAP121]